MNSTTPSETMSGVVEGGADEGTPAISGTGFRTIGSGTGSVCSGAGSDGPEAVSG